MDQNAAPGPLDLLDDPQPNQSASSIAYGTGLDPKIDFRLFRMERGAPYLRAGSPLQAFPRFGQTLYGRVASDGINSDGVIDPSAGGMAAKGSTPRVVAIPNFTFSADVSVTPTKLEISWTPQAIQRADKTYTQITNQPSMGCDQTITPYDKGRIQTNGLVAGTLYNFYPGWNEEQKRIQWYLDTKVGIGTPPIAFTSDLILGALGSLVSFGAISFGVIQFTMPSSGTSSGSSGGTSSDGTGTVNTGGGSRKLPQS